MDTVRCTCVNGFKIVLVSGLNIIRKNIIFYERVAVAVEIHKPVVSAAITLFERRYPETGAVAGMVFVIEVAVPQQQGKRRR